MRRVYLKLVGILLVFLSLACSDSGGGSQQPASNPCDGPLSISYFQQQTQVWCWAAAAQMVISAYGQYPNQCQVASVALLGPAYYNWCCVYPGDCNTPGPSSWIIGSVQAFTGKTGSLVGGPISFDQIRNNLDNCSPVVILYGGSFIGHFIVISDYNLETQSLTVYDPFFGIHHNVPYAHSFLYGGPNETLTWHQTIHGFQ